MTTFDTDRQRYTTEWTPYDASPEHWSSSPEWKAYTEARTRAVQKQFADPFSPRELVTESQEMRDTLARFKEKYPPVDEPTPVVDERSAELRSAEVDLHRAVKRMRKFAHADRVVDLVWVFAND